MYEKLGRTNCFQICADKIASFLVDCHIWFVGVTVGLDGDIRPQSPFREGHCHCQRCIIHHVQPWGLAFGSSPVMLLLFFAKVCFFLYISVGCLLTVSHITPTGWNGNLHQKMFLSKSYCLTKMVSANQCSRDSKLLFREQQIGKKKN